MAEKFNSLIDELNKFLTNTLDYKELLTELSQSFSDEATREKLREFADVKEKESQNLMKLIKQLGGRIESNERITDQEAVSWVSRPVPDTNDIEAVLAKLIDTEHHIKEDYNALFTQKEIQEDYRPLLEKHRQEADANLDYFQGVLESLENKPS